MRNLKIPNAPTNKVQQASTDIFSGFKIPKNNAQQEREKAFNTLFNQSINSKNLFDVPGATIKDFGDFLKSDYVQNLNMNSLNDLQQSTKESFNNYIFEKKFKDFSNWEDIKLLEPEEKQEALQRLPKILNTNKGSTLKEILDPGEKIVDLDKSERLNSLPDWLGGLSKLLLTPVETGINWINNEFIANKNFWGELKDKSYERRAPKIQEEKNNILFSLNNLISENPEAEKEIMKEVENTLHQFSNHYASGYDSKYLSEMTDAEKLDLYAGFSALAEQDPEKAILHLDQGVQKKINENMGFFDWTGQTIDKVVSGAVQGLGELAHGIGNRIIDEKRLLNLIGEEEWLKQKASFNDNSYNDWIQMIHEQNNTGIKEGDVWSKMSWKYAPLTSQIFTTTVGAVGNLLDAAFGTGNSLTPDIHFVDKGTDDWGVPLNEMLRARKTGVSLHNFITAPGEESSLFTGRTAQEAVGMAQYLIPSKAASGATMYILGKTGQGLNKLGRVYANVFSKAENVDKGAALTSLLTKTQGLRDAASQFLAVNAANAQIAEAYSQGVRADVYNENMKPINEAIDNSVNIWRQSEEGQKAILNEYINRGGTFDKSNPYMPIPEDADLYNSIVKEASDSLHENLLKTEYKDAEEAAKKASFYAQTTDFWLENLRMNIFGVSRRQFMYAPSVYKNMDKVRLTEKLKQSMKNPKSFRNYKGDFVESVKKGGYKEGLKSGLKQAGQGFIDNYLDDLTSGWAKGVGENLFSGYIDKLYNQKGTSEGIELTDSFASGVYDFLHSGLEGATEASAQWQSFYDGILGAAGTFVGGNVLLKAPKIYRALKNEGEFKGTPGKSRFKTVANAVLEGVSPFWETIQRTRTQAVEGKQLAEKYNKLYSDSVTTLRDFGAVLGQLEKAEQDQDSVLRLKDGQHNPIIMALTQLKMLEEQMGRGSTPLSLYQKQAEDLMGLDINSEEAKSYTNSYLSVSHNSSLKTSGLSEEAQHKFVFDLLQKRAKKISDFIENLNENYDTLKYMYPNAKESAIAEVLYNRLQRSSWEERLGGLRENAIKTVSKINQLYSELTDEQRSVVETVQNKNRQEIQQKVDKRTKKAPKYARSKVKVLDNEFGDALLKILAAEEVTDINEQFTKDEIDTLWDAAILSDRLQLSQTYEQKALSNPIALDLYEAEVQQTWNTEIQLAEASGRLANLLQQIRDSQGDPVQIKQLVSRLTPTQLEVAEQYLSEEQYNFIPEELKGTEVGDSMQNASKLNVIDAIKQRKPIAEKLETITNTLNNLKNENTGLNDAQFKFIKDVASEVLAQSMEDLNSVEDVDKAIQGIMDDPFVDDNIKDAIKRAAQGAQITVQFEKAKKSQESKEEKVEQKKEAESKEQPKEEKAETKPIETKEEIESEDLGTTIDPEDQEQQIEEESSKLDEKEPTYVVEETTQTPEQIEDANNNNSITEEGRQSINNDVPQKNTLQGTHVIKYQVKPLKDKTQKKAVETLSVEETPALSWVQAVLKWFKDNNIDFQSVIDNELFYFKNAPIHFIRIDHNTLFSKEFLSKHPNIGKNPNILTAVEYTDKVKKAHNKNKAEDQQDQGIIEVNGKQYLVLGLLGYDASQVAAWNQVSNFARKNINYNEKGFALVTKDDGTPIKTTVNNIFLGRRVKSYGDNKAVNTPLHELLANNISNPRGLTVKQLGLGYQTRSGLRVVQAPINATIVKPRDSYGEMTAGATYIFVRQNDGKYYPFMVQPTRLSDLNPESSLHTKITEAVSKLLSKDYDTRYKALRTLFKYLHFSKNYNIYIGKRNQHQLTVISNGVKFSTIDLNNPISAEMLLTTLKDAGFRIMITPSLLTSEASLREYSEAGALSLDVANLQFINGSFMINGIDEQGDEVKQEPQTTNSKNRYEEHSYNFYNNKQRIVKNNSKFYDIEGNEITDPDRVSDLNSISNVVGTTPYLQVGAVRYWLVNDSTVVKADAKGDYSVTHDSAQIQKVKDKKAENEAKAKQKAAEEAAKAALERIEKEQKQREEEELGVKQDNIDEEAELGAEQTYTEDMPFEETAEINPKTGEVTTVQESITPEEVQSHIQITNTSNGLSHIFPIKDWNKKVSDIRTSEDGWGQKNGLTYYKQSQNGRAGDNVTIWFKESPNAQQKRQIELWLENGKRLDETDVLARILNGEVVYSEPIVQEKSKPLVDLSQSKEESRDLNSRLDEDITITIAGEEVSGTVYDIIAEHLMDEKTRNDDALADKRFNELMEEFKNSNLSLKDWLTKKINCG